MTHIPIYATPREESAVMTAGSSHLVGLYTEIVRNQPKTKERENDESLRDGFRRR